MTDAGRFIEQTKRGDQHLIYLVCHFGVVSEALLELPRPVLKEVVRRNAQGGGHGFNGFGLESELPAHHLAKSIVAVSRYLGKKSPHADASQRVPLLNPQELTQGLGKGPRAPHWSTFSITLHNHDASTFLSLVK